MKIYYSLVNMNITRTILATTALLVIGLFSASETSAQERDVSMIKIPKVESRGGVYYVVLDGNTPYARGYQHGQALKFPITMAFRNFTEWLRANAGIKDPEEMIQDLAKSTGYIAAAKQKVPDLKSRTWCRDQYRRRPGQNTSWTTSFV